EQYGGDLGYPRARDAYDPDPASSGRGGRRHDGIGTAHAAEATAASAPVEEFLFARADNSASGRSIVPPMEQPRLWSIRCRCLDKALDPAPVLVTPSGARWSPPAGDLCSTSGRRRE